MCGSTRKRVVSRVCNGYAHAKDLLGTSRRVTTLGVVTVTIEVASQTYGQFRIAVSRKQNYSH